MQNNKHERPPRITDEAQEIEKLLLLLAVDGGTDLTSTLSTKSGLSTRQVNRLLRKSGHATVTRSQDRELLAAGMEGSNDYWCKLTSTPKIVLMWPPVTQSPLLDSLFGEQKCGHEKGLAHASTRN